MTTPEPLDQWNTRIPGPLKKAIGIISAITEQSRTSITEEALREWITKHPLSEPQIARALRFQTNQDDV